MFCVRGTIYEGLEAHVSLLDCMLSSPIESVLGFFSPRSGNGGAITAQKKVF